MEIQDLSVKKIHSGTKDYRQAIVALFLGSMVAFGSEYCVQPIIPLLAESFSLDPATASLAVSFGTGGWPLPCF